MKKGGLFLLYILFISFFGNFTQAKDYEYTNLYITANVLIDGTIDVKEDLTANFFISKHGIIRDIPLNYSVGGKDFHIKVSNINVKGKKFSTVKSNGNIEIRIGDTNRTIIGEQNYPIYYSTYGLIRNFSGMGYAELYRNLVGDEFDTNINKLRAEIILPKTYTGFTSENFLITTDGRSKTIDGFAGTIDWGKGDKIIITYDKGLPAYQGITLAIKFPNSYFEFDHKKQAELVGEAKDKFYIFSSISLGELFYGGSILIAFIIFIISKVILKFEKPIIKKSEIENDLKKSNPIMVRYNPPDGINCAEAGMLYNCILEPTDLTSLLYKWLVEGFISIELENPSGFSASNMFVITKLKNIGEIYPEYEKYFFYSLLPGSINSKKIISTTSNINVSSPLILLRKYGLKKGWIKLGKSYASKNNILDKYFFRLIFSFIDYLILFRGFSFSLEFSFLVSVFMGIFCFCSTINSNSSDHSIQRKIYLTEKGTDLASWIVGYAHFIKTCDEDRLRLFLQQDSTFFDKTLPYAVAFGFETQFIKKITPLLRELNLKPSRYGRDISEIDGITKITKQSILTQEFEKAKERKSYSTYDSSSGFSSGSSFSGGGSSFSSGGGGGGGGGSSW